VVNTIEWDGVTPWSQPADGHPNKWRPGFDRLDVGRLSVQPDGEIELRNQD
jgi:hypothetical protein